MRRELDYFRIEGAYGGRQTWFRRPAMRLGGCAAVTACDCCIYFDRFLGTHLYPFGVQALTRADYVRFGMRMRPYLRPRLSGIDRLELYREGFGAYLKDAGCGSIAMEGLEGDRSAAMAREAVARQAGAGLPVPFLLLKHQDPAFRNYEWHWFLLTGYDASGESCKVKAVTYGNWRWLDLNALWDTGRERKGGMILFRAENS